MADTGSSTAATITSLPGDTSDTAISTFHTFITPVSLSSAKTLGESKQERLEKKKPSIDLSKIFKRAYKDLVAQAQSDCGETPKNVLGMLCLVDPDLKAPQAICVCPTRKLALQNFNAVRRLGGVITSQLAFPDEINGNSQTEKKNTRVWAQVVFGTPRTIKRLISATNLRVEKVKILVFDETDHMLAENGSQIDSLWINKAIDRDSSHCQVLLLSETFNERVKKFCSRVIGDERLLAKEGRFFSGNSEAAKKQAGQDPEDKQKKFPKSCDKRGTLKDHERGSRIRPVPDLDRPPKRSV